MSGHGSIYDWQDLDTKDLQEAVTLIDRLDILGVQCCSEEMLLAMQAELEMRKAKEKSLVQDVDSGMLYEISDEGIKVLGAC